MSVLEIGRESRSCRGGPQAGLALLLACACATCPSPQAPPAPERAQPDPRPADVTVTVEATAEPRPISPRIYGVNGFEEPRRHPGLFTFVRLGGNRTTTYNWENNASNAGADYHHQNDAEMGQSDEPAHTVLEFVSTAHDQDALPLVTVPLIGRVARDKEANGDVMQTPGFLERRFVRSEPDSPGEPALPPDPEDDVVYQDAFVRFVETHADGPVAYSLDNEPGSWQVTHPRLRGGDGSEELTYQELLGRTLAYASAIRSEAPRAQIFGPASFGWPGFMRLGGASDAADRDFLDVYLDRLARAEREGGARLLDVLDVHFYPSAAFEGTPIADAGDEPGAQDLRMQVPRSLYDPSYEEPSWIVTDWLHEPIALLPRLRGVIDAHYPGTKLAITEYNYGGGGDVSGAVAQADVLGAYGRHGVHAAAYWPLWGRDTDYAYGAFELYRRPAEGVRFGDRSVPATVPDAGRLNAWAALGDGAVTVMLVHRARETARVEVRVESDGELGEARAFRIDDGGPHPQPWRGIDRVGGRYRLDSRGPSVTLLVIEAG